MKLCPTHGVVRGSVCQSCKKRRMDARSRKSHARYNSATYKRNRKLVLERDGHACVRCGSKEKLHVHHKGESTDHRVEMMETLCELCHPVAERERLANRRAT